MCRQKMLHTVRECGGAKKSLCASKHTKVKEWVKDEVKEDEVGDSRRKEEGRSGDQAETKGESKGGGSRELRRKGRSRGTKLPHSMGGVTWVHRLSWQVLRFFYQEGLQVSKPPRQAVKSLSLQTSKPPNPHAPKWEEPTNSQEPPGVPKSSQGAPRPKNSRLNSRT